MKVTITENEITVEDLSGDVLPAGLWSCRLAALEACAWASKRLGEEMEKSVQFYRTGTATDNIGID